MALFFGKQTDLSVIHKFYDNANFFFAIHSFYGYPYHPYLFAIPFDRNCEKRFVPVLNRFF